MTMSKILPVACLVSGFLLAGCSKSAPPAPSFTKDFSIYMAGDADGKAVYWKNGIQTDLAPQGSAQAIAVSGTDVYAGGYIYDGINTEAAYWKNGQQILLEGPGISHVFGIAVNGTDVWCVGDILGPLGSGRDSATYWKNGVRMHLSPEAKGKATGILFAGTEMYVSGQVWDSFDTAVVWKNGVQTWYAITGTINAMGLSQTDTIVVGNFGPIPAYWTHDKLHQLAPDGYGTSVAISGPDIYVGGDTISNSGKTQAVYWKNDVMTVLNSQNEMSSVLGIAIAGTDLYAVGDEFDNTRNYIPVYWKNGISNKLGKDGTIYAICIGQ
jgi:hypothetical protein